MAMTVKDDGTLTATPSTEHDLVDTTDPGIYTVWVDLADLEAAEIAELRVYAPVLDPGGSGVERLVDFAAFGAGLDTPIARSVAYDLPYGGRFTLTQVGGSGRDIPWSVHQLDG